MSESPDKLNTIETTLRDVLALLLAERTGTTARSHGWPVPTPEQCAAMTVLLVHALTELVRAMRHPLALVPSPAEVDQVLEGLALGALEKVMGLPSPDVVH